MTARTTEGQTSARGLEEGWQNVEEDPPPGDGLLDEKFSPAVCLAHSTSSYQIAAVNCKARFNELPLTARRARRVPMAASPSAKHKQAWQVEWTG